MVARMRRGRRFKPEIALQLALGGFAAAHQFRDQFVGQHELGLGDVFHREQDVDVLIGPRIVAMQLDRIALDADERAAKPLAALVSDRHLDLDEMAGVALEIGAANQRPIDARRGNLQPIGTVDRVGDVEHRRQCTRHRLAILDLHRSIRPFGHDLHSAAGLAGNPDAHQAIAQLLQDGACDRGDARRHPGLDHQARLGQEFGIHGTSSRFGHIQRQTGSCLSWVRVPGPAHGGSSRLR